MAIGNPSIKYQRNPDGTIAKYAREETDDGRLKFTHESVLQESGTEKADTDQWKHRSDGMRCKTCMWFVPKPSSSPAVPGVYDVGRCRRHAPTMNGYPAVFVNDWCGDHKIDENKV